MAEWPITDWRLEAWMVFGGWQIARVRWVMNSDEDQDQELEWVRDRTVYLTQAECAAAALAFREP
jgi:hypothetical protein